MVTLLTDMGTSFAHIGFATASSSLPRGDPNNAIDGNRAASFSQGSCTLTHEEYEPWWRVYFRIKIWARKIVITNRGDCCGK